MTTRAERILIDSKLPRAEWEAWIASNPGESGDTAAAIAALDARLDTAETDIDSLQGTAGDHESRLDQAETDIQTLYATAGGGGGGGSGAATVDFGRVALDSFTGSDDARLSSALSYAAAQTYPPAIQLTNRAHAFTTANRIAFEGMRIFGPEGYSNPERGGDKMGSRISLSMTGPWFHNNGADVFGVSLHDLSFVGGSGATVLGQSGGGTWYCTSMKGIYSSGLRSVLGTQATKILMTAASLTGDWEINNCYSGSFHIGGSDNVFWSDGMLLDSGTAFNTAGAANGQYHIWFDFCEKSYIGPLYITAEGPWAGIRVSGPGFNSTGNNQGGPLNFFGLRLEGRNSGQASNGSLFRQEGGIVILRDSWISYGMVNPATPGHSPTDAGIIHHSGGTLQVEGCTYDRASTVGETTPFVYTSSTGDCIVRGIMRASKGGTWTGRPRVQRAGTPENRITDSTVTLV